MRRCVVVEFQDAVRIDETRYGFVRYLEVRK